MAQLEAWRASQLQDLGGLSFSIPGLDTPVQAILHLQRSPVMLVQLDMPLRGTSPAAMQWLMQGFEQLDGLHLGLR
jgi:hypothetical protein